MARCTLVFYKQRPNKGERKAFAVIKARELDLSETQDSIPRFTGRITDFFPLMGDIDYISTKQGLEDEFVVCWFADESEDFKKDFRRLNGVKFNANLHVTLEEHGKKSHNASFTAKSAKLK